jgi:hypothetical protein
MTWAIQRYAPDLVVLSGGTGYPHQVADASWFRRRYEPVDIYDEDGFRSVIHQRGLGPSQQRDLEDAAWWRTPAGSTPVHSETLVFPSEVVPRLSLHAYLPPGSGVTVTGDGRPLAELAGERNGWHDYPLALPPAAAQGTLTLALTGSAGDQPASVAWIDSNALPAVHYFVPLVDASQRPRPTIQLDPGQHVTVDLATAGPGPVLLELLHRDRPGVQLALYANGQALGLVGGRDGWQTEHVVLPESVLAQGPAVEIEVRNQGQQFARLAYVALVSDRTEE